MLITPEYLDLQSSFHVTRPDYGTSSARHCDFVMNLCKNLNSRGVLDYGAGKGGLQKGIPFPITNYDPCMPEYAARPTAQYDIVVCTDVLEHIEPECLDAVLDDIFTYTLQVAFFTVATRAAGKFLPDGRNAHLIQENSSWWLQRLLTRGELTSYQIGKGEFMALMTPFKSGMEQSPQ